MKTIWFKRKIYGWGWYPSTWQGWLIIGIYVVLVTLVSLTIDENSSSQEVVFRFVIPMLVLTAALIYIAYKTGEKPRWQWGKPKSAV